MDAPSFRYVPEDACVAFTGELAQGAWAGVDTTPYLDADGAVLEPLGAAPAEVYFKVELLSVIGALVKARSGTYSAADLDRVWDAKQRQLNLALVAGAADPDANKRAAAKRLKGVLVSGGGTKQTTLTYQREVDFGRQQKKDAAIPAVAGDVKLLGLGALLAEIDTATENLAAAIGHGKTEDRPSLQVRSAKNACISAFGWVAEGLARLAMRGLAGGDRETAEKLLEPLFTLAARYPAPPPREKKDAAGPTGPTGP